MSQHKIALVSGANVQAFDFLQVAFAFRIRITMSRERNLKG